MTRLLIVTVGALILLACDRNEEIEGCTHHLAENHDPRATVDDGSCTYAHDEQVIWKDGAPGGWNGDIFAYGFLPVICNGTMILEVDTSAGSRVPACLFTDASGALDVQFKMLNPRDAQHYVDGYIRVDIEKPSEVSLEEFEIYTHGKVVDNNNACGEFIRTEKLHFSVQALSETAATLSVPFRDFNQLLLSDVRVAFGLSVQNAQPDAEVLRINNIRWTRH